MRGRTCTGRRVLLDAQGNFLRVFQTEENGYAHALDALGNELWSLQERRVRRTDLISVAMGRDGTIYFGTRLWPADYEGQPESGHGLVYALWGFDN